MKRRRKKYTSTIPILSLFLLSLIGASFFGVLTRAAYANTDFCPALPQPTGNTVTVNTVSGLKNQMSNAPSGTTILLEDGTYTLNGAYLVFGNPGITVRSKSGNRDAVIIDANYQGEETFPISKSDITLADMTIKRAYYHGAHVVSGGNNVLLYNLKIIDSREQFVKVNSSDGSSFVDNGELACSYFEMSDQGRLTTEQTGTGGSCYTGGIDGHEARNWVVRDNTMQDIYCKNGGLSEHAIHMWDNSSGTIVERNFLINNARGIGFGLGSWGHSGGVIKNNVIHVDPEVQPYYDTGISLETADGAEVYHNTVVSKPTFSSMDYRFGATRAKIKNNFFYNITQRGGGQAELSNNINQPPTSYFANVNNVDYHLTTSATTAIDQGVSISGIIKDLDGNQRDAHPDIGAYEYGLSPGPNPDQQTPPPPTGLKVIGIISPTKEEAQQVSQLRAWHRAGQTFLIWKEVDPPVMKDSIFLPELKTIKDNLDLDKVVRYRIYRSDHPIATVGGLVPVAVAPPLTGWNKDYYGVSLKPHQMAFRYVVEEGLGPVPIGTGIYVHNPKESGKAYYAAELTLMCTQSGNLYFRRPCRFPAQA